MDSQPEGCEDLRNRVAELEKQNRRFKQLGAVVLAVASVIVIMGQAPAKKTVEANEFVLKDNAGNVRARLSVNALGSASMVFLDEKGKAALALDSFFGDRGGGYPRPRRGGKTNFRAGFKCAQFLWERYREPRCLGDAWSRRLGYRG
jgi:hypothetical protein